MATRPIRRGDSWQVKWRENGRQRSATAPTENAAQRIKAYVEAHGTWHEHDLDATMPTLRAWAEHHLEHSTRANADTLHDYRSALELHVYPTLGDLPVSDITADAVRRWVQGLEMADKTRANTVALLSGILTTAVQAGHLRANPVAGIKLPRTDAPKDPVRITPADLAVILAALPEHWRPLVVFLAGTGARWGEAAALTVGDVDLLGDPPSIPPTAWIVRAVKHGATLADEPGRPKTSRSVRRVALAPAVVDALVPLVAGREAGELVFVNTVGRRIRNSTFHSSVWQPTLDKVEATLRKRPRIHDLRAFATTQMIERGVPDHVVADQLGHANTAITHAVYRRINPTGSLAAAAAMGAAMAEATPQEVKA